MERIIKAVYKVKNSDEYRALILPEKGYFEVSKETVESLGIKPGEKLDIPFNEFSNKLFELCSEFETMNFNLANSVRTTLIENILSQNKQENENRETIENKNKEVFNNKKEKAESLLKVKNNRKLAEEFIREEDDEPEKVTMMSEEEEPTLPEEEVEEEEEKKFVSKKNVANAENQHGNFYIAIAKVYENKTPKGTEYYTVYGMKVSFHGGSNKEVDNIKFSVYGKAFIDKACKRIGVESIKDCYITKAVFETRNRKDNNMQYMVLKSGVFINRNDKNIKFEYAIDNNSEENANNVKKSNYYYNGDNKKKPYKSYNGK